MSAFLMLAPSARTASRLVFSFREALVTALQSLNLVQQHSHFIPVLLLWLKYTWEPPIQLWSFWFFHGLLLPTEVSSISLQSHIMVTFWTLLWTEWPPSKSWIQTPYSGTLSSSFPLIWSHTPCGKYLLTTLKPLTCGPYHSLIYFHLWSSFFPI